MSAPVLLDLFCCEGGAGMGYNQAGFEVVGVDNRPQSRYPFQFNLDDALEFLRRHGRDFHAVHASPPCQHYSALNNGRWGNASGHPDLIADVRTALIHNGRPWVIENVVGAPLVRPVLLCGSMFGLGIPGYQLRRHRLFESSVSLTPPGPCQHHGKTMGVYGHGRGGGPLKGRSANATQARELMDMDWASRDGVSQAIPPAYTRWVGGQVLAAL